MGKNILDLYPELRERNIDEMGYRKVVTQNPEIEKYEVENIGLAFALSQRRSEQRRHIPKKSRKVTDAFKSRKGKTR